MRRLVSGGAPILELPWFKTAWQMIRADASRLILLVGEPGTGKTTFAQHAARMATGRPPQVLSCSPETEQSHLFGRWVLAGEETRFVDGPLVVALKTGCWLLLEEFSQAPLECRAALLPLRDQPQITNPFSGEVLVVPPEFRLIATSNKESMACRRNTGIARVLYDGFYTLETPDLSAEQVEAFLRHHFPRATPERVRRVIELWEEYRALVGQDGTEGKSQLGYRAAAQLMALLEVGMEEPAAIDVALVNKFLATDTDLFSAAKLKNTIA